MNVKKPEFMVTCEHLRTFVDNNPGCSLHDFVETKRHHYESNGAALAYLRAWVRSGRSIGIRCETRHGSTSLFPEKPGDRPVDAKVKREVSHKQFDEHAKRMAASKDLRIKPPPRT